MDVPINL